MAHVRDSESSIDGLTGHKDGARAAGEDGPLVLGGELLLDEGADFATLVSVDWFNMRRLLGPIEDIPPAEFEAQYYQQAKVAYFNEFGLRDSRYDSGSVLWMTCTRRRADDIRHGQEAAQRTRHLHQVHQAPPCAPGRLGPDANQECVPCVFIALMPSMKGTSARHE